MGPELDDFIEQYRALLHAEADAQADWLRDRLSGVFQSGRDDPQAVANWAAFENMVRSDASLKHKLEQYGYVLSGGRLN
jgi:hypothetical protein